MGRLELVLEYCPSRNNSQGLDLFPSICWREGSIIDSLVEVLRKDQYPFLRRHTAMTTIAEIASPTTIRKTTAIGIATANSFDGDCGKTTTDQEAVITYRDHMLVT